MSGNFFIWIQVGREESENVKKCKGAEIWFFNLMIGVLEKVKEQLVRTIPPSFN